MDTKTLENLGFINNKIITFSSDKSASTFKFSNYFKNVISIEVSEALIPRGEYTVEPHRNQLFIVKNNNTYSIIFEVRNYTSDELLDALNSRLSTIDITVEYNSGKNILEFKSSEYFQLDMESSSIYEIFGFAKMLYTSALIEQTYVISAPKKANLYGTDILYLHSSVDSSFDFNSEYDAPLAIFYMLDSCYWQSLRSVPERYFHPIGKLDRLTLEFKDKHGNMYDFHGNIYNIQLTVKYIDYGKNWSVLDKESAQMQVNNVLSNMVNSAVSQAISKAEFKMIEQLKAEESQKKPEPQEWSTAGRAGLAFGILATGGYLYYNYSNTVSHPQPVAQPTPSFGQGFGSL